MTDLEIVFLGVIVYLLFRGFARRVTTSIKPDRKEIIGNNKFIWVTIERNETGVFGYDIKNGSFIAWGQTLDEFREKFVQKFPDQPGLIVTPVRQEDFSIKSLTE